MLRFGMHLLTRQRCPNQISVADISVFSLFDLLKDSGADVLTAESAPRLSKLVAAVGANEGIAAQLAK